MAPVDNRLLRDLARSLESFLSGEVVFKALPPEPGEGDDIRLSADPLEVADAWGCGDADGGLVAEAIREAMDGLWQAHFGRLEQARLAVLADALLAEALALRASGLAPWVLGLALRNCVLLAEQALSKLSSEHLAAKLLARVGQVDANHSVDVEAVSSDDDTSWFFNAAAPRFEKTEPQEPPSAHTAGGSLLPECEGILVTIRQICSKLSNSGRPTASGGSTFHERHLFVYASRQLRMKPSCTLCCGIVCHVQFEHLVTNVKIISQLGCGIPPLEHCIFVDASLTREAYASVAPHNRRVKQEFVLGVGDNPAMCALDALSDGAEAGLGDAVRRLVHGRGVEGIFLSGLASPQVETACRLAGTLLVTGLPVRLLCALAEEGNAEVVSGLPSHLLLVEEQAPWEAKVPLQLEFRQIDEEFRRGCFCYPLSGFRQALLPHQLGCGEMSNGPCWEMRAFGVRESRMEAVVGAQTVLLQASCEASLRNLHAQLTDELFQAVRESEVGAISQQLPGRGAWALAVAEAIKHGTVQQDSEHVAPWLVGDASVSLSAAAALEGFAAAFQSVGEREARYRGEAGVEFEASMNSSTCDSLESMLAVVRRTARVVELLVNVDS